MSNNMTNGNEKIREANLWDWLKKARREFRSELAMERVENGLAGGFPDVDGCLRHNGEFKIELKTTRRKVNPDDPITVKFQPQQVPWLEKRWQAGARVWVLLQIGSGHAARRYLIRGSHAAAVANGLTEAEISALSVVPFDATQAVIVENAACVRF